jgi:hypothetical protein
MALRSRSLSGDGKPYSTILRHTGISGQTWQLVSNTGLLSALVRLVTSESGKVPAKQTYEPTSDRDGK